MAGENDIKGFPHRCPVGINFVGETYLNLTSSQIRDVIETKMGYFIEGK